MSDTIKLSADLRTEFGKGAARRTRAAGKIPSVIYGHGTDPVHVAIDTLTFAAVLRNHGANAVLSLEVDGDEHLVLVKSVDQNPLKRTLEHADLLVVKKGEKVEVEIPVIVDGEAVPGSLTTVEADTLLVEADALSIPEEFHVSVEGAEPGTLIEAKDVALPKGVSLVVDEDYLLVNVTDAPTEEDLQEEEDSEVAAPLPGELSEDDEETEGEGSSDESEDGEGSEGSDDA